MAKKSKTTVQIDGSKMEGGGSRRYPEGDFKVKIAKAVLGESQSSGNSQIVLDLDIIAGPKSKGTVKDYLTLTEKALWRVGNLLDALGMKWPKKAFSLDLEKLIGKELGITLADDEYNGKIKSKVADYLDLETIDGILDGSDDDDDDDEDEIDVSELSIKELKKVIKKEKLDVKLADDEPIKKARKKVAKALEEADDDLDELDVDDDL